MKLRFLLCLSAVLLATVAQSRAAAIPVVVSAKAPPVERAAAAELAGYLGRIYPDERFALSEQLPASGRAILVDHGDRQTCCLETMACKPCRNFYDMTQAEQTCQLNHAVPRCISLRRETLTSE